MERGHCKPQDRQQNEQATELPLPAPGSMLMLSASAKLFSVLSAIMLVVAGCDNSPGLSGKWRPAANPAGVIWEFSNDGSIVVGSTRGRYSLGDGGRLKIETPFATSVYRLELSRNRMVLTDPGGSRLEFTKTEEFSH